MATKEEKNKFSYDIDCLAANTGLSFLDAILDYCEKTGLEIEMAASLVNENLKEKIEFQAMENNLMKTKVKTLF
ncbi:MAG: hypothetical protein EOM92_22360 [Gammaproteobacteria bacterium]|jgi:hypothetical protein|nr:hypothetical protein [Gammaproteobacteria bacterium]